MDWLRTGLLMLLALTAGAVIPVQTALNGILGRRLGSSAVSGVVVFLVGTTFMVLSALAARPEWPDAAAWRSVPPLAWVGGTLGGVYIFSLIYLAPRLGVGVTTCIVVLGQMAVGALLDHLGAFEMPQHAFNLWRALAVALVTAGVVLFNMF